MSATGVNYLPVEFDSGYLIGIYQDESERSQATQFSPDRAAVGYSHLPATLFLGIKECEQLWDDIIRCGEDNDNNGHFIGSVVYIEHGLYSVTSQSPLLIIDGQQRVTTASLLIAALAEAVGDEEFIEGFNQAQLRGFYLTNPLLSGEKRYKLILIAN